MWIMYIPNHKFHTSSKSNHQRLIPSHSPALVSSARRSLSFPALLLLCIRLRCTSAPYITVTSPQPDSVGYHGSRSHQLLRPSRPFLPRKQSAHTSCFLQSSLRAPPSVDLAAMSRHQAGSLNLSGRQQRHLSHWRSSYRPSDRSAWSEAWSRSELTHICT